MTVSMNARGGRAEGSATDKTIPHERISFMKALPFWIGFSMVGWLLLARIAALLGQ